MAPIAPSPIAPMVPMPGGGWGPGLTPPPPGAGDVPAVHTIEDSSPPSMGTPAPIGPQDPQDLPKAADAPPAGAGQYLLAAGIGLVFAALIGSGTFMIWRSKAAMATAHEPTAKAASAAVEAASAAPGSGLAETAAAMPDIALHVTPTDATVSVDGHDLPSGTLSIPRPARGKTAVVVVHAKDHEDLTVMVDTLTNSPLELTPKASPPPSIDLGDVPDKPGEGSQTAEPPASKPAEKANAKASEDKPKADVPAVPVAPAMPKPRPAKADPALPANPYN